MRMAARDDALLDSDPQTFSDDSNEDDLFLRRLEADLNSNGHKVEALNNVDLSDIFWVTLLGGVKPKAPDGSSTLTTVGYIVYREAPGILLLLGYFGALPPAMVLYSRGLRTMFLKMGFLRFMVLSNLLLFMGLLPLKMACRWVFNLKYFIAIPEYFTNL